MLRHDIDEDFTKCRLCKGNRRESDIREQVWNGPEFWRAKIWGFFALRSVELLLSPGKERSAGVGCDILSQVV